MSVATVGIGSLGFIGLGVMGAGICRNIATRSGLPTTVWDARTDALADASAIGYRIAKSVAEIVRVADLVAVCLPGGPELEAVCRGEDGVLQHIRPGQVFIDFSTSPLSLTRELAAAFEAKGATYADAPVARGREAANRGTLSIYVGCEEALFSRLRPLLAYAGTDVTHCGGVGAGQIVKLLNNMVLFQTVMALAEGLAIGRAAGLDGETLFAALKTGAADSYALRNHGMQALLPGQFPVRAFSTKYALKDLSYALQMAEEGGVELFGAKALETLLLRSLYNGFAEEYYPAFLKVIQGAGQDAG